MALLLSRLDCQRKYALHFPAESDVGSTAKDSLVTRVSTIRRVLSDAEPKKWCPCPLLGAGGPPGKRFNFVDFSIPFLKKSNPIFKIS